MFYPLDIKKKIYRHLDVLFENYEQMVATYLLGKNHLCTISLSFLCSLYQLIVFNGSILYTCY